jgi:hypothetical protein
MDVFLHAKATEESHKVFRKVDGILRRFSSSLIAVGDSIQGCPKDALLRMTETTGHLNCNPDSKIFFAIMHKKCGNLGEFAV